MSTYTKFETMFLVASYVVSEELSKDIVRVNEVLEKHPLDPRPNWIRRALTSFTESGFAKGRMHHGGELEQYVQLTANGVKEAERLLDAGIVLVRIPGEENESPERASGDIDSSKWTGLPTTFVLTEEKRNQLLDSLENAEGTLDSMPLGNSQKAQVRAYILAAKGLAGSPDPPVDLIWEIINRGNSVAGIASLFVSIIALFI
ncbi:MAG TPA: hypothetical protein VMS43_17760 [Allosphingosinicella sp.]|nr:hypothetical protein [Allosphingosinicella sp.]